MSSNLAPHYDAGEHEHIEVDLKPTTSAMHSGDGPAVSHHAGAVPRGERCGRCFRNKCVRCVYRVLACMHVSRVRGMSASRNLEMRASAK